MRVNFHCWSREIIPDFEIILTDILHIHKVASSANLYRFTHFLDVSFGTISENGLLEQRPQSPSNSICDTGCSFILNVLKIQPLDKLSRSEKRVCEKYIVKNRGTEKIMFYSHLTNLCSCQTSAIMIADNEIEFMDILRDIFILGQRPD